MKCAEQDPHTDIDKVKIDPLDLKKNADSLSKGGHGKGIKSDAHCQNYKIITFK